MPNKNRDAAALREKHSITKTESGSFIVSLDFELFWGVCDHRTIEDYGQNILGVRNAIPAMLELFREYAVRATWATVGLLFFDNKKSLLSGCPQLRPAYDNPTLSPYPALVLVGENEAADPYHFGRSLIDLIRGYEEQEIGSHTFCHYYSREAGQDKEMFRADMAAAIKAAAAMDVTISSLVFPRNQINNEYLSVCSELGIRCFRGTELSWFYRRGSHRGESKLARVARLADSYINLSGHNTFPLSSGTGMANIPASRFLRPYNRRVAFADPLRLRRITSALQYAAENGTAYHLWWHPHNFGSHLEENILFLRKILDCFATMRSKFGMRSLTMSQAVNG